jgi:hypothetical protein
MLAVVVVQGKAVVVLVALVVAVVVSVLVQQLLEQQILVAVAVQLWMVHLVLVALVL